MSGKPPRVNMHPYERLTTPAGEPVDIDVEMVRLVKALWSLDLSTIACCQHVGDGLGGPPTGKPLYAAESFIVYNRGYAWLKMPVLDAKRLTNMLLETDFRDMVKHRWHTHAWRIYVPIEHDEDVRMTLSHAAQIYFPRFHTYVLTGTLADMVDGNGSES